MCIRDSTDGEVPHDPQRCDEREDAHADRDGEDEFGASLREEPDRKCTDQRQYDEERQFHQNAPPLRRSHRMTPRLPARMPAPYERTHPVCRTRIDVPNIRTPTASPFTKPSTTLTSRIMASQVASDLPGATMTLSLIHISEPTRPY